MTLKQEIIPLDIFSKTVLQGHMSAFLSHLAQGFMNLPEYPITLPSQDKIFKPKFWCATIDECITWTLSGFVCLLVFLLKRNGRMKKTNFKRLFYRKKLVFSFDLTTNCYYFYFVYNSRPNGYKWYLIVVSLHSLMISNIEHVFMCLLVICVSSLEKRLFKSIKTYLTCFPPFIFLFGSSFYPPPIYPISITHINTVHLCIFSPSLYIIYVYINKDFRFTKMGYYTYSCASLR